MPEDLSDFGTIESMGVAVRPCLRTAGRLSEIERKKVKIIESSKPMDCIVSVEKGSCPCAPITSHKLAKN